MSPITRRMRVGGLTLNCRMAGAGQTILLLHGWPQSSHVWRHIWPLLCDAYHVVMPDLPGFGDSTKPQTGYDKRSVALSLIALMEEIGCRDYHVVGHDLGGQVAYPLAALAGGRARSLTFIEAGIPGLGDKDDAANPWRGGSWHFGFNMLADLPELLISGREREYLRFLFYRDTIGLHVGDAITSEDLSHYAASLAQPGGLRGSFGHYRAIPQDREDNRRLAGRKLTMPVQVVGAEHGIGLSWLDTIMCAAEGPVTTVLIPASGHYLPEEQPERLAEALISFFHGAQEAGTR